MPVPRYCHRGFPYLQHRVHVKQGMLNMSSQGNLYVAFKKIRWWYHKTRDFMKPTGWIQSRTKIFVVTKNCSK